MRPPRIPLTGADCFLRAFDAEIARWNGASHVSQLVLRLGPGFDVAIFRKLMDAVARAQPMLRARVARAWGIGAPVYQIGSAESRPAPRFAVHDVEQAPREGDVLAAVFQRRLNEKRSLRRGEMLRIDAVRYAAGAAGTDLALSWMHPLFDGAGSERFVSWLDECHRGVRRPDELPDPGELGPSAAPLRTLRERGDAARRWQRWLAGFGAHPVHSPGGARRRVPQALSADLLTLDPARTERAVANAGRRSGFLTPMLFYLAVAIRAHHAVYRARGADPGSYLVPLPVNLRPRGTEGAIFRTHVSLIWFQVLPERADDFDALVADLKGQRLAAIKARHIENGVDAMHFSRLLPSRWYARMARRYQRGELCSFFFAYTGEFAPDLERFCGAEVRNAFHVAPVPPSPGSCLAFSQRGGRLNATHVHQAGVFSESERALMRDTLRADLLDEG
ncbi:MAG: hypothetical protein OEM05_10170 [Myxococcales bacterium]|nr:hypothetical protein [Myxococcales bacterium]